jgi:hypothetical protein
LDAPKKRPRLLELEEEVVLLLLQIQMTRVTSLAKMPPTTRSSDVRPAWQKTEFPNNIAASAKNRSIPNPIRISSLTPVARFVVESATTVAHILAQVSAILAPAQFARTLATEILAHAAKRRTRILAVPLIRS